MRLAQRINPLIDMDVMKKAFFILSGVVLLLTPVEAALIYWPKAAPANLQAAKLESPSIQIEPKEIFMSTFDQSTLFGGAVSAAGSSQVLMSSAADLIKDYRLLGVVLGGASEAIVEDARTQKTNFVKIGERVGELTVKDIREGFIVLNYLNNEVKLEIQ